MDEKALKLVATLRAALDAAEDRLEEGDTDAAATALDAVTSAVADLKAHVTRPIAVAIVGGVRRARP